MRIVFLTFEFPPQGGGIGTYTFEMAKHLMNLGNEVIVLAHTNYRTKKEIKSFDEHQKFKILRYKSYQNKLLKIINRIYFTFIVIKNIDFDLLFITYPTAGVLGMLSKFVFKLPYVIFGHGSEFNQKNIFSKKFISVTYSNADLVIFNSFYTKGLAEDIGIRNRRNIVIPLGGDDEVFDIRKYDKDNLKIKFNLDRKIIILSVGSLRLLKGHKIVINAIDILRREIPSIIYFIIGEGPEQKKLWELVQKLKLEKYIKIVGALTWAELVKYYAMCDIFILNSVYEKNNRQESFGIVFIEAALMGKPVIGTRTGGIAEVIEHEKTGILIQPNSVYETVDGLKKLISNVKFANKLGENGYIKAKKNYTWRNVALQTNFYLKKYFEN